MLGARNDTLWGCNGGDYALGGFGDGVVIAGAGSNYLFGEAGSDSVFASWNAPQLGD
jgi:Ca2+-binding RTX toxin-like protein